MPRTRTRSRLQNDNYSVERASGEDSFAARPISMATPDGRMYARSTTSISRNRHQRSWQWLDKIGEVHYAVHRGAKVAGYTKLYAHQVNVDGSIGKRLTRGLAADVAASLQSPYGGMRGLVERFFLMMKVPGDAYLIRTRDSDGNPNGYDFCSASELDLTGADFSNDRDPVFSGRTEAVVKRIVLPAGAGGQQLSVEMQPGDLLGRVWRPAGQYAELPDSPMRALDMECELLYTLTQGVRAKLLNRLTLNGLMVLDKSVQQVRSGAPSAEDNQFHQNKVLNDLINAMTYAVTNPDEPQSAMPIVLQTSGAVVPKDVVAMITTDREVWQTDMELRRELIDRIIMGLDVQPQHVRGLGEASHWSAWAVSDDERRVSIQPDIEVLCWALTRLVLNAELNAAKRKGAEIERTVIWYDLIDANVKTNLAEDSRQMYDRGVLGPAPARRLSGLLETDAPTDEEYIRWLGVKISNPYMATFGLPGAENLDWEEVEKYSSKKNGPDQESGGDPSETSPGKGAPDKPGGTATPIRKAS